ncbi:MAG: PEP-CTERM sorting domain-containing protein [Phycisphaerales bacterium]|nr:PEP-CTERM sorting domain-containing protein [Phycisphaerales bacterium]
MINRRSKLLVTAFCGVALLLSTASARAGLITQPLAGGWEVTYEDGNNTDFQVDLDGNGFIVIQIFKDFLSFDPIDITFTQTGSDAATDAQIVINDESATNQTGIDWTDYHWAILGDDAEFDVNLTENGGPQNGFQPWGVLPFTNLMVMETEVWADGGVVFNNSSFQPGTPIAGGGDMVINADLSGGDPAEFTFRQFPTPEPGTLVLLASGAIGLMHYRRRRV